jgi:lysophospholipase-3
MSRPEALLFVFCVVGAFANVMLDERLFGSTYGTDIVSTVLNSVDRTVGPKQLTPLVIVPSLIGSRIDGKLQKVSPEHWYCRHDTDWFQLWVPRDIDVIPPRDQCWIENMVMSYNNATGLYDGYPGVEYRVPGWGGVEGVEFLDVHNKIGVWNDTIDILTKLGYVPGKNLVSAPYDWRVGPTEVVAKQYGPLKALIEQTYAANNNTPVALTSLSMGGIYTALFLAQYVNQAWKDQHIASYTSMSGAFGGSVDSVYELLSLDPDNMYGIPAKLFRELTRGWGSVSWLLPVTATYGDFVIVMGPSRNYTAADLVQLFIDAGAPQVASVVQSTFPYVAPGAIGVPVNVIYGYNVTTLLSVAYNATSFPDYASGATFMDGDGTVTNWGLVGLAKQWATVQSQPVKLYPINGMLHSDVVHNADALKILVASLGFTVLDE